MPSIQVLWSGSSLFKVFELRVNSNDSSEQSACTNKTFLIPCEAYSDDQNISGRIYTSPLDTSNGEYFMYIIELYKTRYVKNWTVFHRPSKLFAIQINCINNRYWFLYWSYILHR